jgi:hypothetical protein
MGQAIRAVDDLCAGAPVFRAVSSTRPGSEHADDAQDDVPVIDLSRPALAIGLVRLDQQPFLIAQLVEFSPDCARSEPMNVHRAGDPTGFP